MSKDKVELGDLCRDKITNFVGIAISMQRHITGCDRFVLQSQEIKDGKMGEAYAFDYTTVEVVQKGVVPVDDDRKIWPNPITTSARMDTPLAPNAKPGGPASSASRL